jgi:hypothetical protein
MDVLRYESIDLGRSAVRLLRLSKNDPVEQDFRDSDYDPDDEYIRCELFQVWLDDRASIVPYDALSYTWGDGEASHEIELSGQSLLIKDNLHAALRNLRRKDQDRVIWCDAICIDQENLSERGHQVQLMSKVFSNAECVIFWLGPPLMENTTFFNIMNQLQKNCNKELNQVWKTSDSKRKQIWAATLNEMKVSKSTESQFQIGFESLLKRNWWRRIW